MTTLMVPEHFIQAIRDTGYGSLAFALAELIDNAVDAGASEVKIRIIEERQGGEREITISVLDNGSGMDKKTLWESLRFGGSERFNCRSSLGRYGMGLPNSSVSQAPRVDVYSWRKGARPLRAHLDVNEIVERKSAGVCEPVVTGLPDWLTRRPASGTLVEWSQCDRLRFKKASTLVQKLRPSLGRMYRVSLASGFVIRINGEPISPLDPLFRTAVDGLDGTCQPYGDPIEYPVKAPGGGVSVVTIQFVELPVSRWYNLPANLKCSAGIVGGAGMSVLRGGREIDYGWYLFGRKRRENYDDWWRCELRFEPALDELLGITHSKQVINPVPELRAVLEPDLERIAGDLNARVRRAFGALRPALSNVAATRVSGRDRFLPAVQTSDASARRPSAGGYEFRIGFHREARPEFFTASLRGSIVELEINQNHPFYQKQYTRESSSSGDLDVLLLSAARALFDISEDSRKTLLRSWSDNLLAYLSP